MRSYGQRAVPRCLTRTCRRTAGTRQPHRPLATRHQPTLTADRETTESTGHSSRPPPPRPDLRAPAGMRKDWDVAQVHSVLVRAGLEPCAVTGRRAAPRLRPYVAGYSAFMTGTGAAGRRLLPLGHAVVIVDFGGQGALATSPTGRSAGAGRGLAAGGRLRADANRGAGGSRAADARADGAVIPLSDLLGARADELTGLASGSPGLGGTVRGSRPPADGVAAAGKTGTTGRRDGGTWLATAAGRGRQASDRQARRRHGRWPAPPGDRFLPGMG